MCMPKAPSVPSQIPPTPAPPPAAPAPAPVEAEVGSARRQEETRMFGNLGPIRGPQLRIDRSVAGGGVGSGGSGVATN